MNVSAELYPWIIFHGIIFFCLAMDLGIFNRKAHEIRFKEAVGWSIFWIVLGLSFAFYIAHLSGRGAALEYVSAYLVEKSLSVDNLFVFAIIFEAFRVERKQQHRLLFWGILGAIILRGIMIVSGTALLERFHWLITVFGAFLIYTGLKFSVDKEEEMDPNSSLLIRGARKILPIAPEGKYNSFFVRARGKIMITPLFLVLIAIESSDVIFALDSIPAVLGLSRDRYVIYTSNIFAILGLRSLFFVLEDLLERFWLLKKGLAFVLIYVGLKMVLEAWIRVPPHINLIVILGALFGTVILSELIPHKKKKKKS
jgi:tellurite resistance protein TerC